MLGITVKVKVPFDSLSWFCVVSNVVFLFQQNWTHEVPPETAWWQWYSPHSHLARRLLFLFANGSRSSKKMVWGACFSSSEPMVVDAALQNTSKNNFFCLIDQRSVLVMIAAMTELQVWVQFDVLDNFWKTDAAATIISLGLNTFLKLWEMCKKVNFKKWSKKWKSQWLNYTKQYQIRKM